jgi:sugar porter (SP) family MFS transporter
LRLWNNHFRATLIQQRVMKQTGAVYVILIAFTAAIGGFLLGYDGSVVSGAAPFYKSVFGLEDGSVLFGFSVSCLIWGCMFGNFFAGPVSDRIGRKPTLLVAAFLFITSSLITALAGNITTFIVGRILAGVGVGFAILAAPVFIAEVAPPAKRGWLVSFNQLLIVVGLSSAYFVNYFILRWVPDPLTNWRWMLGVEALPSVIYFLLILAIPESPRWLVMKNRPEEAMAVMVKVGGEEHARREYEKIERSLAQSSGLGNMAQVRELFSRKMKLILIIGVGLAVFQQVSGINSVLYYAPMIFESAGNARDAAFVQAIAIGVVFLVTTVAAMLIIDRLGRKPLLYLGVSLMALSLLVTGVAFRNATYTPSQPAIENAANEVLKSEVWAEARKQHTELITYDAIEVRKGFAEVVKPDKSTVHLEFSNPALQAALSRKEAFLKAMSPLAGRTFSSELAYNAAIKSALEGDACPKPAPYAPFLLKGSIHINSLVVLISILGFIAGFSLSLGPVMWAMFSEIFPNRLRGMAISVVGTINSTTSFVVATLFPVQLSLFGSSATFFIYAGCMVLCLAFVWKYVVETKGKSLEELELHLMR